MIPGSVYYTAEVADAWRLTPHMVRVRFGGEDLRRFASSGCPDERLALFLPHPGHDRPPQPVEVGDGLAFPDDQPRPDRRAYTVRRFEESSGEMDIDFVDHQGGRASEWAVQARPGQAVGLTRAAGWYAPPADAAWQVLLGDATALPAIARIVEELPPGTPVRALVEVPDAADVQDLSTAAELDIRWIAGSGHWLGPSGLAQGFRDLTLPDGPGYLWAAGEASETRAIRRYVRDELVMNGERCTIVGYWRRAREEWGEKYSRVREKVERRYGEAVAAGLTGEELRAARDAILEDVGL